MSRPAISQHLRILEEAGLISEKKVGREHHYQLTPEPLIQVNQWLQHYEHFWNRHLDLLGQHLDSLQNDEQP